jgi:hypothetical protein
VKVAFELGGDPVVDKKWQHGDARCGMPQMPSW